MQIEHTASGSVAQGANVIFNTTTTLMGNITYNNITGVITFNTIGRYIVNWQVATQATASTNGAAFALSSSQGDFIEGNSPNKMGQVAGSGIINVSVAPITLSVVNASTAAIYYSSVVPAQANLMIVQDDIVSQNTLSVNRIFVANNGSNNVSVI